MHPNPSPDSASLLAKEVTERIAQTRSTERTRTAAIAMLRRRFYVPIISFSLVALQASVFIYFKSGDNLYALILAFGVIPTGVFACWSQVRDREKAWRLLVKQENPALLNEITCKPSDA